MEVLIDLAGLVLTLCLSFFISGSEIAFTGLGRAHVLLWLRQRRRGAVLTARWHGRPDALLASLLTGNNLVNTSFAAFATLLGLRLGWPEWVAALGATLALTLGGESLPKVLAHGRSHTLFPGLALPLAVLHTVCWPLTAPIALLVRLLPGRGDRDALHLRAHLHHLADDLNQSGHLGRHESRMIRRALDLRERRLGELMTPRTELTALPLEATPREAAALIHRAGRSSLPLFRGDLDHIVGYVTARDLFQLPSELQQIRRAPLFVPVSMKARDLLSAFGRGQSRLAVVLDEYGGTAGLLTLEDLLEDLVGAIDDEHDPARREGVPLADGRLFVPGRMRLAAFTERTGTALESETADTLGGWVAERLGRIPAEGERVSLPPLHVSIVSATPRQVRHLIVELGRGETQEEAQDQ